jgi:hypothetical protein
LQAITSPTVDEHSSSSTNDPEGKAVMTEAPQPAVEGEGEIDEEEEEEGDGEESKLVFVAKDVERPWTIDFEVVQVAAEILANMCCLVRSSTIGTEEREGEGEGEGDWSDDDENELKMESIASHVAGGMPSGGHAQVQ